jgi:hypothetical protein
MFCQKVCKVLISCILLVLCFGSCNGKSNDTTTEVDMLVKDNFPGYQEDSNWDESWTMGIGSLSYFGDQPGYARLLLEGPGAGGTYHNAELKHVGSRSVQFLYCDLDIRLRNSNNNGWDAPGAPDNPDSLYGFGSRGWGFWNSQMTPVGANIIWFTSISSESDSAFRGTRIWIIFEGTPILLRDMDIDLSNWHTYRIKWRNNYIGVFIDDMVNPIAEITDQAVIPQEPLNFTVWTDNYFFTGDFASPNINYLEVPDIKQYIDVDYVKIYEPK